MEKLTAKQVEEVCTELQEALLETINLDKQSLDIKVKQQKAHKRLSLARDAVRNLKID
jgi:hypothetical protein